jgi:hypothetical protein
MLVQVAAQTPADDCFVGGRPRLPRGHVLPICRLCGAGQTFFFQIAFPPDHAWATLTLAVFSCTSCADESHLIPAMLSGPLRGANIPRDFLVDYQTNFRFEVFETNAGRMASDYRERVSFRRVQLTDAWPAPVSCTRCYESRCNANDVPAFFLRCFPGGL